MDFGLVSETYTVCISESLIAYLRCKRGIVVAVERCGSCISGAPGQKGLVCGEYRKTRLVPRLTRTLVQRKRHVGLSTRVKPGNEATTTGPFLSPLCIMYTAETHCLAHQTSLLNVEHTLMYAHLVSTKGVQSLV